MQHNKLLTIVEFIMERHVLGGLGSTTHSQLINKQRISSVNLLFHVDKLLTEQHSLQSSCFIFSWISFESDCLTARLRTAVLPLPHAAKTRIRQHVWLKLAKEKNCRKQVGTIPTFFCSRKQICQAYVQNRL